VLLAQLELLPKLRSMKNLWDRINLKYVLNPLDEEETKEMIEFRLRTAGHANANMPFFTEEAIARIYQYTQGYPRRISMLCHNALKTLVLENKPAVDADIVQKLISQEVSIGA
jgi:general secretion pathway protein A